MRRLGRGVPGLFALMIFAALAAVLAVIAAGCADDDDDNDDADDDAPDSCPDVGDTTCLDYCLCERELCMRDGAQDACDAALCECADLHGCLIEDVVSDYNCQSAD